MTIKHFISKWSNFWILHKHKEKLNTAFLIDIEELMRLSYKQGAVDNQENPIDLKSLDSHDRLIDIQLNEDDFVKKILKQI